MATPYDSELAYETLIGTIPVFDRICVTFHVSPIRLSLRIGRLRQALSLQQPNSVEYPTSRNSTA